MYLKGSIQVYKLILIGGQPEIMLSLIESMSHYVCLNVLSVHLKTHTSYIEHNFLCKLFTKILYMYHLIILPFHFIPESVIKFNFTQ